MDKISDYVGKQRKNSDGEWELYMTYSVINLMFKRVKEKCD